MAILDEKTLDFISSSYEQTLRLGVRLGELMVPGDLICLSGELGSGKTVLAQGIGRGWGTSYRITSPTFTLVNEYPRAHDGEVLYHIDCYRLERTADIVTAGLEDIVQPGRTLMIEWPEQIESLLPLERLWVRLRYVDDTRRGLRIRAEGERPEILLKRFKQNAFGV
ncbi:MAG: tRNA (adenosine(37)-N6)-threonylcarbamoyltransferase complex ATPase subunit type 1 TsaE [Gammaproteobacteria bacterium]|nr:tRNA (adenosine(37)-N6)-threonylcarbamoyltransferase complex ATPase subunit type 1 TsaE [Gammaproteobacteria bacterium]